MDLRAEKERQRSALLRLRELSSAADREFADKCESLVVRGLGLTPPVLSRLEMQVRNARDAKPDSTYIWEVPHMWCHIISDSPKQLPPWAMFYFLY